MILLPPHIFKQYRSYCAGNGVNGNEFADYLKWLRYFLDFCCADGQESKKPAGFLRSSSGLRCSYMYGLSIDDFTAYLS